MEIVHAVMLGTTNEAKIRGVQAAFHDVQSALQGPDLRQPSTWSCAVETGVSEAPWGFPVTVQGAQNRAQAAYAQRRQGPPALAAGEVLLGIGVESGFIEVAPETFTSYNFDVCALFDGHYYYLGISPGFEYPRRLVRNVFLHRQPFQQARQYITTTAEVEQQVGIVGVLAGGLIDRPEMTRLATRLALIRYIQRHDYTQWD
ncbi:MAG: inosine/xanthosine triphosphatase [Candidatus Tectimicrobiota bacterium]